MKCACSKHEIVIRTDPKNFKYLILSGTRRNFGTPRVPVDDGVYFLWLLGVINILYEKFTTNWTLLLAFEMSSCCYCCQLF